MVGCIRVEIVLKNVDFPHPDGPRIPNIKVISSLVINILIAIIILDISY